MYDLEKKLFEMQDQKYKEFQCRLIPTAASGTVIGVRVPLLRKFAKEFSKTPQADAFLQDLPHKYYDENNLHCFLISNINDFETALREVKKFLPYVDNWATCDMMSPGVFRKNITELYPEIELWLNSSHTYTIRFAIKMLMSFSLDSNFKVEQAERICKVMSKEYYVNMMIAWYFATALAKQYEAAVRIIEEKRLSVWVHNKSIQKAIESYRITDERKKYLRALKQ
ncbi:MAG: DNA alkylation repair protein [Clostridia bacterium]|nr:DNA alkylation repair protein [Clostridia bacterium]